MLYMLCCQIEGEIHVLNMFCCQIQTRGVLYMLCFQTGMRTICCVVLSDWNENGLLCCTCYQMMPVVQRVVRNLDQYVKQIADSGETVELKK